jgi:threonine/homoserine/homoserine lactone efflux protein
MAATNVIMGFLTGLPALIAVGPIALLLIEQGLARGIRTGYPAALGVAAGDTVFAVLAAVAGTALSAALADYATGLRLVAVGVLVAVAVRLFREAGRAGVVAFDGDGFDGGAVDGGGVDGDPGGEPVTGPAGGALATVRGPRLAGGFLGLTVINPLTIVVYAGIVVSGGAGVGTAGWVLGMGLASLAVHSGFVGLGHAMGSTLSPRAVVGVRYAAVALLVVLALHLLLG